MPHAIEQHRHGVGGATGMHRQCKPPPMQAFSNHPWRTAHWWSHPTMGVRAGLNAHASFFILTYW
jgi:hypothetical protein